ncbi:MAG: integrase family protein [Oscillospiraceae bacterium]|jgi:integrase|nr:integrase family protein [Oscillospiraceae bacterium]
MANIKKLEGKNGISYKLTASGGYRIDGSQKRYYKTWTPEPGMTSKQIEKELNRQAVLFDEECRTGGVSTDGSIKFEAFAKQWFKEYAEPRLKTRTLDRYHQMEERVYTAIGHLRIDKITTRSIQLFVANLSEPGMNKRTGKPLSPKTIKNYHGFISSIMHYAVSQGIIRQNPCAAVMLPKPTPKDQAEYTLEEAQLFLKTLETEAPPFWRVFYNLAIYSGFRRGELLGLEWKDIDFDTGVISIRRTSLYTKERGVYTDTPKTKGSSRSLKMSRGIIDLLKWYKAFQTEERLKAGDQWEDHDRVFAAWNGQPVNPSGVENWLYRFFERTGLKKINPHGFRHLNATLLINSGADVRTVSAALGHSQTSTTLNIYAHAIAEAQARATDAISDMLDSSFKGVSAK